MTKFESAIALEEHFLAVSSSLTRTISVSKATIWLKGCEEAKRRADRARTLANKLSRRPYEFIGMVPDVDGEPIAAYRLNFTL